MNITEQSNNIAYFMLPGFCEHYELYKTMNNFLSLHPEAKRENAEIYCYYGNIPFCTWDGGRIFNNYQPLTFEQMQEIQKYYNVELKSKIRFVFTNNLLKEEHLYERYNNIALNIFNNPNNEVVLNSDILENYLHNNFPNYKLIASTTRCSNQDQSRNDLNNKNYIFTCLDYNLNHNWKFLETLTPEEKEKTEFLVNPICGPGCGQRKEHYRLNSLFSLTYGKPYKMKHCEIKTTTFCSLYNSAHITADDIYNKYLPAGFHYFKLEGRTWSAVDMAITISEYLIKPEFRSWFLREVLWNK